MKISQAERIVLDRSSFLHSRKQFVLNYEEKIYYGSSLEDLIKQLMKDYPDKKV